jgi:hypothetical protein
MEEGHEDVEECRGRCGVRWGLGLIDLGDRTVINACEKIAHVVLNIPALPVGSESCTTRFMSRPRAPSQRKNLALDAPPPS